MKEEFAEGPPRPTSHTTNIIHGVLARADDPVEAGHFVVEALRKLTGAHCVVLLESVAESDAETFRVISASPSETHSHFRSARDEDFRTVLRLLHGPACLWTTPPAGEFRSRLELPNRSATVAVPLDAGTSRVGALLALGVPAGASLTTATEELKSLASTLALVMRNSFLCRRQADLIEEQTRRLRESNEALRRRETEYRTLADNQPDVIMRFDREGRHLYVNAAAERASGIPRASFTGRSHQELGFPEPLCRYWGERVSAVFETGLPMEEEFSLPGPAGEVIFNWRLIPEAGPDGIETVLSLARDITEHRRAEQSYRQLFAAMLDGFALHEIVCDSQGEPVDYRFLSVNPAFERMTGLRAEALIGRTVLEVMPETERFWIRTYGKVALTGEPVHLEHKSVALGRHFEVEAFRPAPGQFAVIFADITDRVEAEAQKEDLEKRLRQAQKMEAVGTLAGGIAHDFNNILTPIMAHADLAHLTLPEDSPVQSDLKAVVRASERAAGLVRQILALSRREEHAPALVHLSPLVKEAMKLLRSTLPSTIEIREDIDSGAAPVFADPAQLHQVLLNLCTNARDAMQERGGVLTVRVARAQLDVPELEGMALSGGQYTSLSVTDTGAGIAPAVHERIFEPYYTTKAEGTGTGLGLAVVHGIVRLCGGDILVRSRPGEGSTFEVLLPAHEEAPGKRHSGSRATLLSGRGRVLFVDDEDSIVQVGGQILKRLGYDVTAVSKSDEALALFRDRPLDFDLVVTDQTMPKITGTDLIRHVLDVRPELPVVLTTGFSERLDEERAEALGACELVSKPFTPSTLGAAVKRALLRRTGQVPCEADAFAGNSGLV